jgi:hypothetical protein
MSANPSAVWPRVRTFLFMWLAVVLVPLMGGKLVHLAFAALVAAVLTVLWWWFSEVGALAEAADWAIESRGSSRGRGADPHVARLHRQVNDLAQRNAAVSSDAVITQLLVEIIDERVLAHHGIDRLTDPRRYAAVIGPDLDGFVRAVAAGHGTVRGRQLPTLLSRIEQL